MDEPRPWAATYSDGRSATLRPTHVRFDAGGLIVEGVGVWPYHLIRLVERPSAPGIRLETAEQPPQAVTVSDLLFRDEIARWFPALLSGSGGSWRTVGRLAGLACASIALLAILWFWVLPALVSRSARFVPLSFEEQLGEAVTTVLAPASKRCGNPETLLPVEQVVRTLEAAAPSRYRYRVFVVDDPTVNAFAAPGGFVVVNRGLIEKTGSSEELAGVLAHEMQHVIQRHSTRALLRRFGIDLLTAYVLGDAAGLASLGAHLGEMSFMREDESSADREGMAMIQRAGLDPHGLVRLLEMLEREQGRAPDAVQYFSTHPATAGRTEAMRALAAAAAYTPRRLLPGVAWPPSFAGCGSTVR